MKEIWRIVLKITGWKIVSEIPPDLKKYIIAIAPHTSYRDFIVGVAIRGAMGFRASFLAKDSLFRFPFGYYFRAMGGIPVDRSKSHNIVEQITSIASRRDNFILAIAPEGTRKKVAQWKSGFYYISLVSGIPIIPALMDWEHREVRFLKPFVPSGNINADMPAFRDLYRGVKGYRDL